MAGPVVTDDAEGHPPAGGEPQPPRDAPSGDATYPAQRQRLAYQPGFDGIRGVGLTFVMLNHFGVPWAKGGVLLGVDVLHAVGLLDHVAADQGAGRATAASSLSAFWSRRFRRLMPGAVITLLGVVVFGAVLADPSQLATLRTDGIAALFYVANWAFIIGDRNYADLFASPSPVQHFWTLSIEEQFYIVFPLLLIGLLVWGKRNWRVVAWALGGVTLLAAVWGVWLYAQGASVDRIYFGTDTRLPELTAGVLLAVVVHAPVEAR
ncbi:MAG: acyltransferase [Acidimicrobiales bacterium]